MSGGLISDVLYDAGTGLWNISSAVVIVAACQVALGVISSSYDRAVRMSVDAKRLDDSWSTSISMGSVQLIISIVSVIGAARLVLREEWVEQMTSGLVVGLGFGLQATIQDTVTGFIRRSYRDLMQHNVQIEVHTGMGKIQGSIERMHLSTFELRTATHERVVLPWTSLREFKILDRPILTTNASAIALRAAAAAKRT